MYSRWASLKNEALTLRRRGYSIRDVEKRLGIPRSTLSGWFHNVSLAPKYKAVLEKRHAESLIKARAEATRWHNAEKAKRVAHAFIAAKKLLTKIGTDKKYLELALAMLYLGEGGKTKNTLTLGNSDLLIVSFYIDALETLYNIPRNTLRIELHLRADQNERVQKRYWSKKIPMPVECFKYTVKDMRTLGRPTYPNYHGVCVVLGGGVAIQRKLLYLARGFAEQTAKICAVSSVG